MYSKIPEKLEKLRVDRPGTPALRPNRVRLSGLTRALPPGSHRDALDSAHSRLTLVASGDNPYLRVATWIAANMGK